jgi:putative DNA primase/helicase
MYRNAGWRGVLPIGRAPAQKNPPPSAFTGHGKPDPSGADIQAWLDGPEALRNIGLRLPEGVIGLDVDAYPGKRGGEELTRLLGEYGPLPPTWITSARTDGISGIRLFRVPTHLDGQEINWPGEAGKHIEIIQHGHRYAIVWPSINPEAAGATYKWRNEADPATLSSYFGVPAVATLAELPETWVRGLALSYERAEKGSLASSDLAAWWSQMRGGEACPVVHKVCTTAVHELRTVDGSRHETARDAAAALARLGGEGHRGAGRALEILGHAFGEVVGAERLAGGEWSRLLNGAVQLAATAEPTPRQACDHDAASALPDFDPHAFFAIVERDRRAAAEAAAQANRDRLAMRVSEVEALPFEQRAEAVRRLIPEIAQWGKAEQSSAREALSRKSGLTDLGLTEFAELIKAEERDRKQRAEVALAEEQHARHTAAVAAAAEKGRLLPPPHAPIDVARDLAERMPFRAAWWRGDYYRWDGTRYRLWRDEAVDNWLYAQTADALYEQADDKGVTPWRPTENKITGVSHALSRGVLYRSSDDEPDDSPAQVACANGVYDVVTGTLLPHDPQRFNLQSLAFDYDPQAKCPIWEWFLNDVLPPDAQRFLRQWFGYILSGRTDLEKIAHLQGRPRSGKGTAAHVLEALVGGESVASPSMPSLVGSFGEQPLIGKTLAIFSDISWSHRDIVEGVEILKKISGNDTRDVNRKNREVWHGRLGVRFMIMGNDMPRFTDASGALAGRMIHIQFPGTVAGRERTSLKAELLAELPGILNWALEGLRELTELGRFTEPATSAELAAEVRRQQSPVQAFLDDTCAFAENVPPVPLDELFPVYRAWARAADAEHALDRERFSRALASAGLTIERKMIDGVRARRVHGIVPQFAEGRSAWVALLNPAGIVLPPPP